MRARFTFISLLLLVLLATGYFLSYMAGFLTIDLSQARQSLFFWRQPEPAVAAQVRIKPDIAMQRITTSQTERGALSGSAELRRASASRFRGGVSAARLVSTSSE